jgi:hypothetical protein
MNCMKGGVLWRIAFSGLLLLARVGMAEEALGKGTLGMPCLDIEKVETETGGKFTDLFPPQDKRDLFPSLDGLVSYTFDRTRRGYKTIAGYTCLTAKSVVVAMKVQIYVPPQDIAQVARMEVESAKRAGYKLCREFEEIGGNPSVLIYSHKRTVVLRKGSREYAVEQWLLGTNGPPVVVSVGPKAYMSVHCK